MLQNSDIVKGSMLQVKVGNNILGFATSHSLSITTNTTEISTKDHGDYPAVLAQSLTWEVSCENLYTEDNEKALMAIQANKTLVHLIFCPVNYDANDEKGIVGNSSKQAWTPDTANAILEGDAYLTSFQMNAPAGDNATISCTFTGCGSFTTPNLA